MLSENNAIRVSVITPVYNGEKFLKETLESVAVQTLEGVEHIVVNDGSTDKTGTILTNWSIQGKPANYSIKIKHQENGGESAAINAGLRMSVGKYILVLSADDLLLPNALETLFNALEANEAIVAYPDWLLIDEQSQVKQTIKTLDYYPELVSLDLHCAPGPGALIRRGAVFGDLRDETYRLVPDLEQWIRLSKRGQFMRIPIPLAAWRQHEGGTTFLTRGKRTVDEFTRLACEIAERETLTRPQSRRLRGSLSYVACLQGLFDQTLAGRANALKALALNPKRFKKSHGGHWLIALAALMMPLPYLVVSFLEGVGTRLPPLAEDLALSRQNRNL
jgi:hypothetical protein